MAPRILNATINLHHQPKYYSHRRIHHRNIHNHNQNNYKQTKTLDPQPCGNDTCLHCLKIHAVPPDNNRLISNTGYWWCYERPATKWERPIKSAGSLRRRISGQLRTTTTTTTTTNANTNTNTNTTARLLHDDAIADGVELAYDQDMRLPSDKSPLDDEQLLDVNAMLTMDDIRHIEPMFVIRTVTARRSRRGRRAMNVGDDGEEGQEADYVFVNNNGDSDIDDVLSVVEWGELD